MRPLKVALVHRTGESTFRRTYGPWSYAVPEFEVTHFPVEAKYGRFMSLADFASFDLVVHEDGKCIIHWQRPAGKEAPRLAYVVTDSTLSEQHYRMRWEQAKQADLILVDWDRLERFEGLQRWCGGYIPVKRCSYAVNDLLFFDRQQPRVTDVGFFANMDTPERQELDRRLRALCQKRAWSYESGTRFWEAYAIAFNRSRVCIHLERNEATRAHRVFDVMASRSCLLTPYLPPVSGEEREAGRHYWLCEEERWEEELSLLLSTGLWEEIAEHGYELVRRAYTWRTRAAQLRWLLSDLYGLGEEAAAWASS